MNHTDYRSLIDKGRKSGLKTSELYRALSSRPADTSDFVKFAGDGNGFAPALDEHGHSIYKPLDSTENR